MDFGAAGAASPRKKRKTRCGECSGCLFTKGGCGACRTCTNKSLKKACLHRTCTNLVPSGPAPAPTSSSQAPASSSSSSAAAKSAPAKTSSSVGRAVVLKQKPKNLLAGATDDEVEALHVFALGLCAAVEKSGRFMVSCHCCNKGYCEIVEPQQDYRWTGFCHACYNSKRDVAGGEHEKFPSGDARGTYERLDRNLIGKNPEYEYCGSWLPSDDCNWNEPVPEGRCDMDGKPGPIAADREFPANEWKTTGYKPAAWPEPGSAADQAYWRSAERKERADVLARARSLPASRYKERRRYNEDDYAWYK